jgi:signal peptidase I
MAYFRLSPTNSKTARLKPLFVTPLLSCFYTPSRLGGKLLFASRLRKPRRFRLICFRPPPSDRGPACLTLRLCGLPGDVLEIRKGILYVNNTNVDKDFDLIHIFKVDRKDTSAIAHNPKKAYTIPPYDDIVYIPLHEKYVREKHLPCHRYLLPPGLRSESIYKVYKKNWNEDNFGPVKVPPGGWFVLGDDRGHSIDSRHFGFIDKSALIGTFL